jgi:hypothetical protein
MKQPVRVAVTGAAGQVGYQLCFGEVLLCARKRLKGEL